MGVDYRGDSIVVDVTVTVLDDLNGSDTCQTISVDAKRVDMEVRKSLMKELTLFLSLVREHRTKCDVANTLDAFCTSVELVVDDHSTPLIRLNTDVLQSQFIGIGFPSDRNKDNIGVELEIATQCM